MPEVQQNRGELAKLAIFDGYLDRYKQLMTSLNHNPKEGL